METKVFNLIILDESGSMDCIKGQALSGVNETLQTIRAAQQKYPDQQQLVTFVPFQSGSIKFVRDCVSIDKVEDLRPEEYNPGTCTPLYDAIGISVTHLKRQVSSTDSVLVTIITDGYENASREFSAQDISRMTGEMKEKGWLFTYIGANQDALEVARTLNIHNAMNFVQDEAGTSEMFARERKARAKFNAKRHSMVQEACLDAICPSDAKIAMENVVRKMSSDKDYFKE